MKFHRKQDSLIKEVGTEEENQKTVNKNDHTIIYPMIVMGNE